MITPNFNAPAPQPPPILCEDGDEDEESSESDSESESISESGSEIPPPEPSSTVEETPENTSEPSEEGMSVAVPVPEIVSPLQIATAATSVEDKYAVEGEGEDEAADDFHPLEDDASNVPRKPRFSFGLSSKEASNVLNSPSIDGGILLSPSNITLSDPTDTPLPGTLPPLELSDSAARNAHGWQLFESYGEQLSVGHIADVKLPGRQHAWTLVEVIDSTSNLLHVREATVMNGTVTASGSHSEWIAKHENLIQPARSVTEGVPLPDHLTALAPKPTGKKLSFEARRKLIPPEDVNQVSPRKNLAESPPPVPSPRAHPSPSPRAHPSPSLSPLTRRGSGHVTPIAGRVNSGEKAHSRPGSIIIQSPPMSPNFAPSPSTNVQLPPTGLPSPPNRMMKSSWILPTVSSVTSIGPIDRRRDNRGASFNRPATIAADAAEIEREILAAAEILVAPPAPLRAQQSLASRGAGFTLKPSGATADLKRTALAEEAPLSTHYKVRSPSYSGPDDDDIDRPAQSPTSPSMVPSSSSSSIAPRRRTAR